MRHLINGVLGFAFVVAASLTSPAAAAQMEMILVPVDVDREALRREDPVVRRATRLIGEALVERGQSITYDDWFESRQRLGKRFVNSASEWIREARRMKSRADAMIALKIYEHTDHRGNGGLVRIEIRARIYKLPRGGVTFETSATSRTSIAVPRDCDRDCSVSAVTPALELMTPKIAEELVNNLPRDRFSPRRHRKQEIQGTREYHLAFNGFSDKTMRNVVKYLEKFSGYRKYEFLEQNHCQHSIAYLTRIQRSKLESNMRRMFRELRLRQVRLRFDTLRVEASLPGCQR